MRSYPLTYPFQDVEEKWNHHWKAKKTFNTALSALNDGREKCYVLSMFPYPSGRIHMGHVRNYAIGDAIARYKMAQQFEVLHPMGWDAFGMPAENAAVEHGISPATWTKANIESMKLQLSALGFSFDWGRELATCDASYYGLEQKFFLDFYAKGLIERKESWVNWDPVDGSVLANEQVIDGRGWRSGALVEKRKLTQWSLKITHYAEELLAELPKLTGWPEKVIRMQENWIGKSQGATIRFQIVPSEDASSLPSTLEIFTTRPETLFGASFCAVAPTHPIVEHLMAHHEALKNFVQECQRTPTTEEALSTMEKKGIDTGLRVKHPFKEEETLPIYAANFVLMEYGTGALFGCPAHDERDHEFALKYNLPILPVITPSEDHKPGTAYTGDGFLIHSDFLNGLSIENARLKAIDALVSVGLGEAKMTYRLRDWCVSRQRYWGCPIPVIHCKHCGVVPVPKEDLPVRLPEDVAFGEGGNPLENHPTWKHVPCPHCQSPALRETDTLDTFFESSWYFLRFCNPTHSEPLDQEAVNRLMPVDWYIGGIEHAVLHLLYARFFTKALRDCGYVSVSEPFKNLVTQGMVCHPSYKDQEGHWLFPDDIQKDRSGNYVTVKKQEAVTVGRSEKMSKSKKNVIDPEMIIKNYGADAARLFVLSDTPPDRDFEWSAEGIEGAWRYLNRVWRLVTSVASLPHLSERPFSDPEEKEGALLKAAHQSIQKFSEAYEKIVFNKAIAFLRELTREIEEALAASINPMALREACDILIRGLAPICPFLCSELSEILGEKEEIHRRPWPIADEKRAAVDMITIAVQVNGKMRGSFTIAPDSEKDHVEQKALSLDNVQKELNGRTPKRTIIVPNRIVNIVV